MTACPRTPSTGATPHATAVIGPAAIRAEILGELGDERDHVLEAEALPSLEQDPHDSCPSLVIFASDDRGAALSSAVGELGERWPQARVVLVCSSVGGSALRGALAAGASGVVLREELHRALRACLRAVRAGQTCLPRRSARAVEHPVLSAREKQILGLVVMGCMNSEIAERLFLAESTVKSHLSSVFGKLEVRSRNEAVEAILDPERGLSMGILALGAEPVVPTAVASR
jgi:DNA-binding NarL/FixJ family response regulator